MQQYNVRSPFQRIAIDVADNFLETETGNKYIWVVVDHFSKWIKAFAVPNQKKGIVVVS